MYKIILTAYFQGLSSVSNGNQYAKNRNDSLTIRTAKFVCKYKVLFLCYCIPISANPNGSPSCIILVAFSWT